MLLIGGFFLFVSSIAFFGGVSFLYHYFSGKASLQTSPEKKEDGSQMKSDELTPPAKGCVFAFEAGGRAYWKFADDLQLPFERAMAVMDWTREYDMRIDREYLRVIFETILACVDNGKISDIARLVGEASKRLENITHLGLMYKIASALYFETNEDPCKFSLEEAMHKIAFWKEHQKDIDAFFLQMPIGECVPYLHTLGETLESYSKMSMQELSEMFSLHSGILHSLPNTNELRTALQLLIDGEVRLM